MRRNIMGIVYIYKISTQKPINKVFYPFFSWPEILSPAIPHSSTDMGGMGK